jgi:hypothetical protein
LDYISKTTHSKKTNNEDKMILHNSKLQLSEGKRHEVLQVLLQRQKKTLIFSSSSSKGKPDL